MLRIKQLRLFIPLILIALFSVVNVTNAQVSLAFTSGYMGTQGSNTNQADGIKNLSTLGISRVSFGQPTGTTFGGTQGNDLAGVIKIYLSSGRVISLNGALNWRETVTGNVIVFGFIFDLGQNATINYGTNQTFNIVGGTNAGSSTTLGLKAYAATTVFVDGENRSGNAATSGLLTALNNELANSPQPSTITLTNNSVVEGNNLVYTVTLNTATTVGSPQTYTFSTSGSASKNNDYNATYTFSNGVVYNGDGTITVPGGVSSFTVTITTIDDAIVENIENLILNIGSKSGLGSIKDNDTPTAAICDVNSPYDKIISGYHQSIAVKTDASFAVWGEDLDNTGAGSVLTPLDITSANFPNLVGTPLKAAIGGQGGGGKEQAILLTTDGLYAWGNEGYVIDNALTTSSTFAKILTNQFTASNASSSTGLPLGVNPFDVKMMTASYGTLVILTNSGDVWVLSLLTGSLNANGSATVASKTWYKAKTNSTTYLSDITAVRVQASTSALNAVIALKTDGSVYTWGASTYLGDGSAAATLNYATQMTLPAEFSITNIPKMIAVSGGVKNTSTVKNSYYILSNSGSLYSLGYNTQRQLGDFTTTERTSWVNAKINSTTNFSNVSFITAQEHDASLPGVAVVTKNGDLYTWGENEGLALGRTTDGTFYDPGMPLGFNSGTDIALSAELGGHTLVYIKQGTSQFCYVGHKTSGSMGDGVSASSFINTFNCTGTPSLSICGSVPVTASPVTSVISANPTTINADGTTTSLITVQLKQSNGTNLLTTGGTVEISTDKGTVEATTDNNDGTYTTKLTSSTVVETAKLTYTLNGTTGTNSATVNFVAAGGTPTITSSGTLSAFTTCLSTASAAQSFSVSASNLTADLTVTAPTGYQVASTQAGTYSNTLTLTATSGTVSSTNVWVRLTGTAAGTITGSVSLTSTGATTQNIAATGTVSAASVAGTISGSTTVSSPTNSTVLTLSGYTGSIQWQSSTDNSTFNNITGATSATYTATNVTATTYYKAVVTSGVCTAVNSGVATITYSATAPTITTTGTLSAFTTCLNTASAAQSFSVSASNLTADLTVSAPTGYQVASTQAGTYSNTLTLTETSGTISSTNVWVRLTGTAAGTITGSVSLTSTGATTQNVAANGTVSAASVAGTISGSATVSTPTNSTVLTLSGYTGSIQWQSSTDNSTFNNITGATSATYTATNVTATTYYKAVVTSGVCTAANSGIATITYSIPTPTITATGTLSAFTTCLSTASAAQSFSVSASNLTADLTVTAPTGYQVASTQAGTYSNTLTLTATSGTVSSTNVWVRLTGTAAGTITGSVSLTSTGATTQNVAANGTVSAASVAGTISGSATVSTPTNSTVLTLSGYTGSIQWQSSTDNTTFNDITGATSATYTATNLTATTYYKAVVTSGVCSAVNSGVATITYSQPAITANSDNNSTSVKVPVSGNVSTNDKISSGTNYGTPAPLTTNPSGATITIDATTGNYTFTGTLPGKYSYYIPVCASGQTTGCVTSLLQITVLDPTIPNNAPVANSDLATTNLNTAVTTTILSNDKSGNIGTILNPASVTIETKPLNGTVVVNTDGSLTYTPTNGFTGTDSLVYNVCDNATTPNCASTYVYYTVLAGGSESVTTAVDDYAYVSNNKTGTASVSGNVLKNDKNTANSALTATIVTTPSATQGKITFNADGTFTFVPTLGFSGPVDVVYNACTSDITPSCAKATLHIIVNPPPTINPDFNSTNVNTPVPGSINTNDVIPAGTNYGTPSPSSKNPSGATLTINATTGTYTFTASKPGKYIYMIPVCAASQTTGCPLSPLEITVLDPNRTDNPPVANNDYSITQLNTPVSTLILSNDKPGNKNTILDVASITINTNPKNGTAKTDIKSVTTASESTKSNATTVHIGSIIYTPNTDFAGLDSLVYTVCDNASPSNCEVATVYYTISTSSVTNELVANDDYNSSINRTPATGNVLTNDDYGGATLTATLVTGPTATQGVLVFNTDGTYTFTPALGFSGPVDIIYQACSGTTCVNATLHILVQLFPPAPPVVKNATYIAGSSSNPTNVKSLVTTTPTGTTLKWCDPTGTTCTNTPPLIPNTPGTYIWCVKSVDTVTLLSSTCAMDTVIIIAPYSIMEVSKSATNVKLNPDGSTLVTFVMKASNKTDASIDSVSIKDDLSKTFNTTKGITVYSLDVFGGLVKSSGYDGISNIDLVTSASKIAAKKTDSLILKVLIESSDVYGNLLNVATMSGKTKYGKLSVLSNDPLLNPSDSTKLTPTGFTIPKADIIIAGGFSPNQDGLNDKWIITRPFGTTISVKVFNRWGNIVFGDDNYKNDWDGRGQGNFIGDYVPEGTYFYMVDAIDMNGNVQKFAKSLTIVR